MLREMGGAELFCQTIAPEQKTQAVVMEMIIGLAFFPASELIEKVFLQALECLAEFPHIVQGEEGAGKAGEGLFVQPCMLGEKIKEGSVFPQQDAAHRRHIQAVVGQEVTGAGAALLAAVGFGPIQEIGFVVGQIGHDGVYGVHPRVWFIPACAGNMQVCPQLWTTYRGSSPRVRGTWFFNFRNLLFRRFIPASAGNIVLCAALLCNAAVHPRECGEHGPVYSLPEILTGSSPRVRGTLTKHLDFEDGTGFIPACAGNMITINILDAAGTVHPRVCGEHGFNLSPCQLHGGSSPRVRGT